MLFLLGQDAGGAWNRRSLVSSSSLKEVFDGEADEGYHTHRSPLGYVVMGGDRYTYYLMGVGATKKQVVTRGRSGSWFCIPTYIPNKIQCEQSILVAPPCDSEEKKQCMF
jgi:hypothetical protein